MSWYPMGIPPWPFSFTSLPERVTFENDKTGETVEYTQHGTTRIKTACCDMWKCDECGEVWWQQSAAPCYCPSCGRRAVS